MNILSALKGWLPEKVWITRCLDCGLTLEWSGIRGTVTVSRYVCTTGFHDCRFEQVIRYRWRIPRRAERGKATK